MNDQPSSVWQAATRWLSAPNKRPAATHIGELWQRVWFALNELAGHAVLVFAIVLLMWGLEEINHAVKAGGLMILNGPWPYRIPLDWYFSLVDAGAMSRLVYAGFKIFRNL